MASFLNTSHTTTTSAPIPSHITKDRVLEFLHSPTKMILLNPIVTSHTLLPPSSSTTFFASESDALRPSITAPPVPVYQVTEKTGSEEGGGTWRGGWAKRFVPDEITYETAMQAKDDGLVAITHAPMGVHSVTTWMVRDAEGGGGGLFLDERGVVTSNRMLMGFIRTTLQESHDNLVRDFVAALEREAQGL